MIGNHRIHPDTSNRSSGRRMARLGVVAVAVASGATLAATPAAAAETSGAWHQADLYVVDGLPDTWMRDVSGDGGFDQVYLDVDQDQYVDGGVWDFYGDGTLLLYDVSPVDFVFETVGDSNGRPSGTTGTTIIIDHGDVPVSPPGMPNSGCLPFALPDGWECRPA